MADQDQQDFDEFDTLVDDNLDDGDDLSFDKPETGRKKRQTVFYFVLIAFIALVGVSVWFVFLRQPETNTNLQPVISDNGQAPTSDLPPGVSSAEAPAGDVVIDPVTGQPVAQQAELTPQDGGIVPVDPSAVTPEVATPQLASPEVAAVDNAAPAEATVTSTGTTVEALPPPIATETAPEAVPSETPAPSAASSEAVIPAAPEGINAPADMAETPAPSAIEPVTAPAADIPAAPVAVPTEPTLSGAATADPAMEQRLSQIEAQIKSLPTSMPASSGASPELAAQLKALSAKLDNLTNQVESLDQRTTNFATELQNRSNAAPSAPAPAKKSAAPKRRAAPVAAKKPVASSWELRSAQPGVAWLGKPGSGEMNRFAIGQTAPGLGTIQDVRQEGGRWVVKTTGGTLRQ